MGLPAMGLPELRVPRLPRSDARTGRQGRAGSAPISVGLPVGDSLSSCLRCFPFSASSSRCCFPKARGRLPVAAWPPQPPFSFLVLLLQVGTRQGSHGIPGCRTVGGAKSHLPREPCPSEPPPSARRRSGHPQSGAGGRADRLQSLPGGAPRALFPLAASQCGPSTRASACSPEPGADLSREVRAGRDRICPRGRTVRACCLSLAGAQLRKAKQGWVLPGTGLSQPCLILHKSLGRWTGADSTLGLSHCDPSGPRAPGLPLPVAPLLGKPCPARQRCRWHVLRPRRLTRSRAVPRRPRTPSTSTWAWTSCRVWRSTRRSSECPRPPSLRGHFGSAWVVLGKCHRFAVAL